MISSVSFESNSVLSVLHEICVKDVGVTVEALMQFIRRLGLLDVSRFGVLLAYQLANLQTYLDTCVPMLLAFSSWRSRQSFSLASISELALYTCIELMR
jgi:hypothetical protein